MPKSRSFISGMLATAFACALFAPSAIAQSYPSRTIKVIVPFPAGGVLDSVTRSVVERLKDKLGQAVIVENRGGAGGTLGLEACRKAAPDGYTLCAATIEQMTSKSHLEPDQFARYGDLMPITQMVTSKGVLFVNPALGVSDINGLVRLAKERPGKLNYASFGWGSAPHLLFEWLNARNGIDLFHVPHKGAGHMMTEILGGRADVGYVTVGFAKPYIAAGKIKPLAVLGKARSPLLPDVPSFGELGLDFPYEGGWFALMGPPGIEQPITDKIVAGVRAVLQDPEYQTKFLKPHGYGAVGNTPTEFAAILKRETEASAQLVKTASAKPRP